MQGSWNNTCLWCPAYVGYDQVNPVPRPFSVENIRSFADIDPIVISKIPVEHPVPRVDRDDAPCSTLEEAVGEPADVAPEVGATKAARIKPERVKRVRYLPARTRDE